MNKQLFVCLFLLLISVFAFAKPSIGVVGDYDYAIMDWLSEAEVSYLSLSLSDLSFVLDHLDVVIINEAEKLEKPLVDTLKRYLRTDGKMVIFSGVLGKDLLPGTSTLDDDSLAFTLGIRELTPLADAKLNLPNASLPFDLAYTFNQRRSTPLAKYQSDEVAVSLNNQALVFGLPSITINDANNLPLKELFLDALKEFTVDFSVLEKVKNKVDPLSLTEDTKKLYLKAINLEEQILSSNLGRAYDSFDEALELFNDAYLYSLPSKTKETRAVWFRPPTTKYSISQSLDSMEKLGINLIFVETWWEGGLLYPNGPVSQRAEFKGFDPLEYIISEAHKRNIEVHAWLEVFFSGFKKPGEILEKHPDWACVGMDGSLAVKAEDDKYFIEPAHLEARRFLIDMFVDMAKTYHLDGIHLDYVRYPLQNPTAYGFSPYVKERFEKSTGLEFPLNNRHSNWPAFSKFKEEQVTSFVAELRKELLAIKPLQISAAVFPGNDALINKNQNWPLWVDEGYLDFISLMLYSRSTQTVENWIKESLSTIGNKIPYYPALAAISIPEGDLLLEQTLLIHKYGLDGVAFFAWQHFTEDSIATLSKGPFRNKATQY
ncbi:MAG: family 10 glycosylhydrolase [Firmicutes bacterium]|nr:family 10 glycosylhydrolase [Bacillota bacterium]